MAQHIIVIRPNEVVRQDYHHHTTIACDYVGLRFNSSRAPRCSATQIHNEQG